jgi:hypothetical protein
MPMWRSWASVDPSTASPRSKAGSSDRSDGERNGAYEGGVAPPTSSGMAIPAGGTSTRVPSAEIELESHAVPLSTDTTWATPRIWPTDFPSPAGRPPGVHARSVSGVSGCTGGGVAAGSRGRWTDDGVCPPESSPRVPPASSPAPRAAATTPRRTGRRRGGGTPIPRTRRRPRFNARPRGVTMPRARWSPGRSWGP